MQILIESNLLNYKQFILVLNELHMQSETILFLYNKN